jgi:thiamine-monophosphate kinase
LIRRNEEELIRWIESRGWPENAFVRRGIGDDCAVCRPAPGHELVVTTDLLVEGRHFLLDTTPAADLGWKIGAANLSDIAAMGARPVAFFLSAAFPAARQDLFAAVMDGLRAILSLHATPLAGGDLSAADHCCFAATVLGEAPAGRALLRSGARPGDGIFVTGSPGFAGAGLRLLAGGWRKTAPDRCADPFGRKRPGEGPEWDCLQKHLRPEPRLAEGLCLRDSGAVTAAIDTSDGIAKDLRQICVRSGAGALLDDARLQALIDGDRVTLADVLGGGEDYELLVTVDPAGEAALLAGFASRPGFPPLHRLGRIVAEHPGEVRLAAATGEVPLPVSGFDHFRP